MIVFGNIDLRFVILTCRLVVLICVLCRILICDFSEVYLCCFSLECRFAFSDFFFV